MRSEVVAGDRPGLLQRLETARTARISLPTGAPRPSELAEVRIPVLDQPGELASITLLATDLDVNIFDLEIAFLFPWAISLGKIGVFGFWSMMIFLGILTIGFIYEWRKGALEWE